MAIQRESERITENQKEDKTCKQLMNNNFMDAFLTTSNNTGTHILFFLFLFICFLCIVICSFTHILFLLFAIFSLFNCYDYTFIVILGFDILYCNNFFTRVNYFICFLVIFFVVFRSILRYNLFLDSFTFNLFFYLFYYMYFTCTFRTNNILIYEVLSLLIYHKIIE